MRLTQLTVFQVHPGERDECCRAWVPASGPGRVSRGGRRRPGGKLRGALQLPPPRRDQREMSETAGSFGFSTRSGCGGHTRIEDAGRLVKVARPQLDNPATAQHPGQDRGIPAGVAVADGADQRLRSARGRRRRIEVPGATRGGETDHRRGQPACGGLTDGKAAEDAFGEIKRGGAGSGSVGGQRRRGGNQVRPGSGPDLAVRQAGELAGQREPVRRLDDLADRQPVDDQVGRKRPVVGLRGVPYRIGEQAVTLIPPGSPPVQQNDSARALASELEPQHLREQRVVAIPPAPGRLDERIRGRQSRQDSRGVLITGQLPGELGTDLFEDARVEQNVP